MNLINKLLTISSLALASMVSLPAAAKPVSSSLNSCTLGAVTVTSVTLAANGAAVPTPTALPIDYKNCYGAFAGNDQPYPSTNLGYLDDGLLNGEPQKFQGPGTGGDLFGNGAFLNDPYAAYDLNGDGLADPGWIFLGKIENPATGTFDPVDKIGDATGIVWSSFFTATFENGVWKWAFTPDKDVAARAGVVLGDNYFDQFALVFKQSKGFAAYNFTGEQFGITHPDADDPILNFYGTADLSDVFGSSGLSHISLWARDPGFNNDAPEPGSLALFGIALLGLVARRRKAD